MSNPPSHVGGSRSGPVQGIELPEHEPLDMDLAIDSPFQMSGDPQVDLGPVTAMRVENEDAMHISDSALRNYKLNEVDSDGTSRIQVTPVTSQWGSSRDVYSHSGTNPASSSSGPPTMLTETTRMSSSRTNWNTDEVIQPGTPNRSAVDTNNKGDEEKGKGASGGNNNNNNEASATSKTTDASYTLSLEQNNGVRWFAIGVVALILLGGIAIAGIVCGTGGCGGGGGEEESSSMFAEESSTPVPATPVPIIPTANPTAPPSTTPAPTPAVTDALPAIDAAAEEPVVDPMVVETAAPTDPIMVEETASPTDRVVTSSPTAGETTQEPTAMPSGGPTMTITDSPTTAIPETMAPTTESPTSSPTGPPVTIGPTSIVPGLSAETVAKQGDFSTPQGQAFFFVEGYPGFEELPDWRKQQLFGMATFFNAFNGRRWPLSRRLNWLDADFHECDWASIQSQPCDLENKMEFLGLLNDDSLTGYVAPEVGLLTELEELSVDLCGLTGNATTVLPEELSALSNLRLFSVSRNALTGTMPSTISSLSSLQFLHLDDNQWTGTIPADWGQLTFLREINIGGNIGLTGTIPLEWAALTNLESLIIEGTGVSGAIPTELCNVPTLTVTADCGNIECC